MATNIYRNEFFLASYVTCGFSDLDLRIVASALSDSLSTPMLVTPTVPLRFFVYSPRMHSVSHPPIYGFWYMYMYMYEHTNFCSSCEAHEVFLKVGARILAPLAHQSKFNGELFMKLHHLLYTLKVQK